MTFLSFSWIFGLLTVLHGVLDSNFKLYAFCCQWTHQGRNFETKWLVPWFDCDGSLTWRGLTSNPRHFGGSTTFILFMWRIAFAYLVVCRWQVRHSWQWWGLWQDYETWCRGSRMVAYVRYSVAGWSGGRLMLCAVYTVYVEMRSAGFLVEH
jgi:hypothetical protein